MTPQTTIKDAANNKLAAIFLAGVVVAVVICYGQLTRYFFAQDDFILLQKAVCDPAGAVFGFFRDAPGQFRPLTKGLYFVLAERLFGMNAPLYHAFAIAVHVVNVVLVFAVLRRWRVAVSGALIAATLFALSSGFFHVLAWISCIQQLLAMTFVLLSIKWGIDALDSGTSPAWKSAAAYVLALLSFEETLAVPLILLASTIALRGLRSVETRNAFRVLWPHWAAFVAYALLMLMWKGLPDEGVYGVHFGANVARNLATYAAWTLHYFAILPGLAEPVEFAFSRTHLLLGALVAYHLIRGRWRRVLFGLMCFAAIAMPAAALRQHTYYLHTYIPSLGILYLVALAIADVFDLELLRATDRLRGALGISLVVLSAGAHYFSRANETAVAEWSHPFRSSFVIRRALIAETMSDAIGTAKSDNVDRVVMVYARTRFARDDKQSWNNYNVMGAIGGAAGIRLLYGRCDLDVLFTKLGEDIPPEKSEGADVFYYDDLGNCRLQGRTQ